MRCQSRFQGTKFNESIFSCYWFLTFVIKNELIQKHGISHEKFTAVTKAVNE